MPKLMRIYPTLLFIHSQVSGKLCLIVFAVANGAPSVLSVLKSISAAVVLKKPNVAAKDAKVEGSSSKGNVAVSVK